VATAARVSPNKRFNYRNNGCARAFWSLVHFFAVLCKTTGTLRKTRRQQQRERHQTKGLITRTMAVHVHYNSWYISLPSSAKQQREMTIFCVVWRTWTTTANFSYFYLELNAFVAYSAGASFNTDRHTGQFQIYAKFQGKIEPHFLLGVVLAVAVAHA